MKKISIGYFADGPWSHNAFKLIIDSPYIEIKFIVPRNDTNDQTLKIFSTQYNIDYLSAVNVNSDEFYEAAKAYNCDLFVSMSYNQIFKKRIIDLTPMGIINCHAGKLPFYRGRNILNWAIINDEKEYGITVHFVDQGVDTGDIILQRTYPISDEDTYSTLLDKAIIDCADILYAALQDICKGENKRVKQDTIASVGLYCGMRNVGDEIINWNRPSREVFNFIRAICAPGPKAQTFIDGKVVKINKARMIPNAPVYINTVGQVLIKTKEGFLVKTKDSFVEILEIESDFKIKIGDKFK